MIRTRTITVPDVVNHYDPECHQAGIRAALEDLEIADDRVAWIRYRTAYDPPRPGVDAELETALASGRIRRRRRRRKAS